MNTLNKPTDRFFNLSVRSQNFTEDSTGPDLL